MKICAETLTVARARMRKSLSNQTEANERGARIQCKTKPNIAADKEYIYNIDLKCRKPAKSGNRMHRLDSSKNPGKTRDSEATKPAQRMKRKQNLEKRCEIQNVKKQKKRKEGRKHQRTEKERPKTK